MTKTILVFEGPEEIIIAFHGCPPPAPWAKSLKRYLPTRAQVEECPVCGADGDPMPWGPEGTEQDFENPPYMMEHRKCMACGAKWTARYVLVENILTYVPKEHED